MNRFLVLLFGIVSLALFGALFGSSSANAASVFDDTYRTTDLLSLQGSWNPSCEEGQELFFNSNILDVINNKDNWQSSPYLDDAYDEWNSTNNYVISYTPPREGTSFNTIDVSYSLTDRDFQWVNQTIYTEVRTQGRALMILIPNTGACEPEVRLVSGGQTNMTSVVSSSRDFEPGQPYTLNYIVNGSYNYNYPVGYEGQSINNVFPPDPEPIETLRPEYVATVATTGKLSISYTKNIEQEHTFLTGSSFFVLEKMNENWQGVDENVYSNLSFTPAGSLTGTSKFAVLNEAEKIDMVLPEAGYYMIRIDHNQQLDSPPWEENASELYYIEQVYLQLYWDGSSVTSIDNIGGCDGICNPYSGTQNNKVLQALRKFNVDDHGLQAIIFMPIEFIATLPSIVGSCTPLNVPFISENMSIGCVSQPIKQAYPGMTFLLAVFINGLVTLGVAMGLFRTIKNLHDPKKDEIEVLNL